MVQSRTAVVSTSAKNILGTSTSLSSGKAERRENNTKCLTQHVPWQIVLSQLYSVHLLIEYVEKQMAGDSDEDDMMC